MLTDAQVAELHQNPPSREALSQAEADNNRLTFHARVATQPADAGPYRQKFLDWAKSVLAPDKYARFEQLLVYPLASTALIQEAADEWNKVFSAQDRLTDLDFGGSEEALARFEAYLERLGFATFFENSLFQAALEAPASVVVVDMAPTPTPRPAPYCYTLRAGQIHHLEVDPAMGTVRALMYEAGEGDDRRLVVIDDESYRTYAFEQGTPKATPETTGLHYLGYCPVFWLWNDRGEIAPTSLRRQNILTSLLGRLDFYAFWAAVREYARLTGENPLLWRYVDPCTYADAQGNACNAGFVTFTDDLGHSHQRACPACNENGLLGPGTVLEMTTPRAMPGGSVSFDIPAGFIEPSADLGRLGKENLETDRAGLWRSLTGITLEATSREAQNEDQVRSQYESRHAVLSYWAENLEPLYRDLITTLARLAEPARRATVNATLGRDFFLLTRAEAVAEYEAYGKAGLPVFLLGMARQKIQALDVRGNPKAAARVRLLELLEPYPDSPLATVPAGSEAYELKANFNFYVGRFEAEIGPLETFGALLPMKERLHRISEILYGYVRDFLLRTAVATPGGFSVGDSVMVKPGKEHMPSHKGMTFTIAEIQGDTYALKLPDGSIHKWYTADELMGMSAPKNSPVKAGMAM